MKLPQITVPLIIALAAMFSVSSCDSETENADAGSATVSAETAVAQLKTVPKAYRFTGDLEGERKIDLSTKVMGRITTMPVELGDAVSKGDLLLRVKNDNLLAQRNQVEANLAEAKAALRNTETNYNRIQALHDDSSATQKELDDITTAFQSAQARVQSLESKYNEVNDLIDYTVIRSPIEGYLVRKNVSQGDMASPGRPLMTVEEVAHLKVRVSVPAAQIGLFSVGDTLGLSIGAAGEEASGVVRSVNPSADPRSGQYEVKVAVLRESSASTGIKPGMFADVTLQKGEESVLTVPREALVNRGQLTGLYTLNENNELLLRWVQTGREIGREVEILSGISAGETYVIAGDRKFREGQQIAVR